MNFGSGPGISHTGLLPGGPCNGLWTESHPQTVTAERGRGFT